MLTRADYSESVLTPPNLEVLCVLTYTASGLSAYMPKKLTAEQQRKADWVAEQRKADPAYDSKRAAKEKARRAETKAAKAAAATAQAASLGAQPTAQAVPIGAVSGAPWSPWNPASWFLPAAAPQVAAAAATPVGVAADPVAARQRLWEALSSAERATAESLGFEQWSWDAGVVGMDDDAAADGDETVGLLLHEVHQVLGMRLCRPLAMSEAQRSQPLAEAAMQPCFLVHGVFESMGDEPGETFIDTRWASFDAVYGAGLDYDPCGSDGQAEGYDKRLVDAMAAFQTQSSRLCEEADARARAEIQELQQHERERQAPAMTAPPPRKRTRVLPPAAKGVRESSTVGPCAACQRSTPCLRIL
jgi:hypothetical protein